MASDSMQVEVENVLKSISRQINCLSEENRNTKKRALEGIRKEVILKKPPYSSTIIQAVFKDILKPLLNLLSDPVEKCRELASGIVADCLKSAERPEEFLSYVIPILVQRLGQQEIIEPSEEIRLVLVQMLSLLVELTKKNMGVYVDDVVKILQRTIVDPYPEVKKESCKCASAIAKAVPEHFHMQSESLIQPLLMTISHQHSRVRIAVINTIGDVIQYGNGKSVDDVVSHFAQRLFDQSAPVRAAVTSVVGHWLLDLMDRYSFHHKLIPLLLTSMQDEMPDVKNLADSLWHDVGLKYEGEQEEDLKDKQDFMKPDPDHYPVGVDRPNLGCRQLVYRHFSKIILGLLRDLSDWVVDTRIKSGQLLYTLILNDEENVTQHMEKILTGLYRACHDDEAEVVRYVVKSAELCGYFVSPEVWCKLVLNNVKTTQSMGSLMVLAAIIRGSQKSQLEPYIQDICSVLMDPGVCALADASVQMSLLSCVDALLNVCQEMCSEVSLSLFTVLIYVLALHRTETIRGKVYELLDKETQVLGLENRQALFDKHTREVIASQQDSYDMWTQHSSERLVFDTLILESGPVVGEILEDVIPVLVANLKPNKDPEVRLKFFSLLSRLVLNAPQTVDSQQRFGDFAVVVVRDMIIPNCVWVAGRTAGAIRTIAVSSLWALLKSGVMPKEKLLTVMEDLLTQMRSTLEDANKDTRMITCRSLTHMFNTVGKSLDQHNLHNMYPDLLKRLDDSSDDVRVALSLTFVAYIDCFEDGYDVSLYKAHLQAIYKGLLVHLDDPEPRIQEAVLQILLHAARIMPEMLMREVDEVKHKHRSTKYCDKLVEHMYKLGQEQR